MQPVEISPVELFLQAGPVVKAVIILLIAASVWCWVIILESFWKLRQLKKAYPNYFMDTRMFREALRVATA